MKLIYKASWILFAILLVATILTDSFNSLSLVGFSLAALTLVYALALWSVFTNNGIPEPANMEKV